MNARNAEESSMLAGISSELHPLARALALTNAAATAGFDWPGAPEVFEKVDEELQELKEAASHDEQREELGDLLFVLVTLAHHLGFTATDALNEANEKFIRRFQAMEAACRAESTQLDQLSLAEMDALWDEAKRGEH
jgi:nucleoside triphosphate diphosphatase